MPGTWLCALAGPNPAAVALSPAVGWLLLAALAAGVALFLLQLGAWRRFWWRTEDPRALGLFRIVFAALVLGNVHGLWEHFEFLFTDQGLLLSESAREVVGRGQFAGFGVGRDGEAAGFFDWVAVGRFLQGPRYSLLLFRDDPAFMWAHVIAFEVVTLLFLVGWRTRLMGLASLVLMSSLANRAPIYWTGADVVYRAFFPLLLVSRCGHAYSLDNWLRVRRLRTAGETEPPIHRPIPAWPRMLMILQLAAIYVTTGSLKTGHLWATGDSLYYALNLDHFHRVPTQLLCAVFGTNVFRVMTWTVHAWQMGFPLLLVGLVLRWARRENLPRPAPARAWAIRAALVVLGGSALAIVLVTLPVHWPTRPGPADVRTVQVVTALGWVAGSVLLAWGYRRLRDRPFRWRVRGHELVLDLDRFCRWVLGRRVWLGIGVIFHAHIFVLMNIGMFAPVMVGVYVCCLNGSEVAVLLRRLRLAVARLPGCAGLRPRAPFVRVVAPDPAVHPAHGRLGRWIIGPLIAFHVAAVAIWLLPDKGCVSSFRGPARELVRPWLYATQTEQSWGMFAPNPMRTNDFLHVLVTDREGTVWDLHTDANSPRNKDMPWIWYDRAGKITRRVTADGKHWRKWIARYHCRRWAAEHGGVAPERVSLYARSYSIPPPGTGSYRPADRMEEHGRTHKLLEVHCRTEPDGQLPDAIRIRLGLPLLGDERERPAVGPRRTRWEAHRART
jgi:hypothetical protein